MFALAIAVLLCSTDEHADSLFREGRYEELMTFADSTLGTHLTQEERMDILEYKAYAQVVLGDTAEARETFQQLLILEPGHHLDPIQVSPKMRSIFDRARENLSERSETSRLLALEREVFSFKREYQRNKDAFKWSLLFPGLGQMRRKSPIGLPLLVAASADVLFLGISHYKVERAHRSYLDQTVQAEIDRTYGIYRDWYRARGYALGTLGCLWLISALEAALSL